VNAVSLRSVEESDIEVFFRDQADPEGAAMAIFPSRTREGHFEHWHKILADTTSIIRTVDLDGEVAGNVVSWLSNGERLIGYWIGRSYWGRGVATDALALFVAEVTDRPLVAHVASLNVGSVRVLEKCGFVQRGTNMDGEVEELVMELPA